jgi:hypothetical protein
LSHDFSSSLFSESSGKSGNKPVVRVGFARPDKDRIHMGWTGKDWDNPEYQRHYTRILKKAAKDLDVDLRLTQEPLGDEKDANSFLERIKKERPDGLIVVCMDLNEGWPQTNRIARDKGKIPTVRKILRKAESLQNYYLNRGILLVLPIYK